MAATPMKETCVKCGHVNHAATGLDSDSCPKCGVVYIKALSNYKRPAPREAGRSSFLDAQPVDQLVDDFAKDMRKKSLYPYFRTVIGMAYWLGMLLVLIAVVTGVRYFFSASGESLKSIISFGGAAFLWLFVSALREASVMLADLSDATLRIAQRGQRDP